jgi:tetratricopeptide (TPR) repeat protein
MNIPAYWGGFSSQIELEFASDEKFSRALALLEKDRFVEAASALNEWMLSAGDAALVRRGAALFDLARARRWIINGDLTSARQTLERSMDAVPEAAFGAVADDFVAAGGSETVLGNWLRNLARQDDFGHSLIKAFGSAVRIGDIFDKLSPASCYAIISVMPAAAYADIAKTRLHNEIRLLARGAIFDPRAPRLVQQLLGIIPDVRENQIEGTLVLIAVIITLGDRIISPAGSRIATPQSIAAALSLPVDDESEASAEVALAGWVESLTQQDNIARDEFRNWLNDGAEPQHYAESNDPPWTGSNERFIQTRLLLMKLEQTPIASVQNAEGWLQHVLKAGLPDARLATIRLRLAIRIGAVSDDMPLADTIPAAASEGISLPTLLETYPQHALRGGKVWRGFTEQFADQFIEAGVIATALRKVTDSILAEPTTPYPGFRKLVVDIAGNASDDTRRELAGPILEAIDRLIAASIKIAGLNDNILQRLLCPDGTEQEAEFDELERLYPHFKSSPSFVELWRHRATRLLLENRLGDDGVLRLRAQVGVAGTGHAPNDAVVLVQLGEWDQALQLFDKLKAGPKLSVNEQTLLANASMQLAIAAARAGSQDMARSALGYAITFAAPFPAIVAVEIGLLGDAPHRSQKFLKLVAEGKLLPVLSGLLDICDKEVAENALRDLPLNLFLAEKNWNALTSDQRPAVARFVIARILADVSAVPALDKPVLDILLPHIKDAWTHAREHTNKSTIAALLALFRAQGKVIWMQLLADIAGNSFVADEFGRLLVSSGLMWSENILSLALHLAEWLGENESKAILAELPLDQLTGTPSWKMIPSAEIGDNLCGLTSVITHIAALVDTREIIALTSHFAKRVMPTLSFDKRIAVINALQPLLAHAPHEDLKGKFRAANYSLFDNAGGNHIIDAAQLNDTAVRAYAQYRLLRVAASGHVFDDDWRNAAQEAIAALGGDRDPFIFAARLRLMFLLEQDEAALSLAEGFVPPPDKALQKVLADVLDRLLGKDKLELLECAISFAARAGLPVDYLHALDIRFGLQGEGAVERAARVVAERRAFGTLVELLRPIASYGQNSSVNAADDTANTDAATLASATATHIDEDGAAIIEAEHSDTIDATTDDDDAADALADEDLDAVDSEDAAISEEAAGEAVDADNAPAASSTDLTDDDAAPEKSPSSTATVENTNELTPKTKELVFDYLQKTPSAAFAGPLPEVKSKSMWLPERLALFASQLTDVLNALPAIDSPDIPQLRFVSYLYSSVLPLVAESEASAFKTALISVAEYLSAPGSETAEPAGRLLLRLVPPAEVTKTDIAKLTETIVDDISGNDTALATLSAEALDQAVSDPKAFRNIRQRIWLNFAANRFGELARILRDKSTKPLPVSERRQLQQQLLDKCLAAAGKADDTALTGAIDAYIALVPGASAQLLGDWLRFWSGISSFPFLERLEKLGADGSALRTVLVAMDALSADQQTALIASLPAGVLVAPEQWSSPAMKKDVLAHPISFIMLLEGFSQRVVAGDAGNVRIAAENFADSLLPNLPKPLQLACIGCLGNIARALDMHGQNSAALESICRKKVSAEEFALAVSQGTKSYGPEIVSAIVRSRLNFGSKEQLEEIVPQLEAHGVYEEARAIVEPLLAGDDTLDAALANLRLSQALGNSESAEQQARDIVASNRGTQLSLMDRLRIFLVAPALRRVKNRMVNRLAGLRSSRLRIMRAQAAARASILLGDVEQTKSLFATLSKFALVRFAPAEIGALLLLNDYAGAEAVAERFVDRVAKTRGKGKTAALEALGRLERFMPLAAILQRYYLNEGRDPAYLANVTAIARAICTEAALEGLTPAEERQAFSVLQTILRAELQATKPDDETVSYIIKTMLGLAGDNDTLLARLANVLSGHWHARAAEIGHKALKLAETRLNASIAKDGVAILPKPKPGSKVKPKKVAATAQNLNVAALDLPRTSRIAKALTTVLSLAERVNADQTIATYAVLGDKLLKEAQRRRWSSHATLVGLANRILTTHEVVDTALDFLTDAHGESPRDLTLLRSLATGYLVQGQNARAKKLVLEGLQRAPNERSLLSMLARIHENDAEMDKALAINTKLLNMLEGAVYQNSEKGDAVSEVLNLRNSISVQNFWIETAKVSRLVPQPQAEQIKGVVFTSSYRCMVSGTINAVPLLELKKRGFNVVHLNSGTVDAEPTGHALLDQFSSIIQGDGAFVRGARTNRALLFYNWTIDPENRIISANGLNFYQPIFERLTQQSRSYTLDFSSELIQNRIRSMIRTCDRALHVAERIRNEVAALGIPVRFISSNWQYPPYCTFRIACEAWGKQFDMSFVACSPGYESYFSNLGQRFSTTAAIVNMTRNPTSRAPFLPVVHKFHKWYAENQDVVRDAVAEINAQITADRAGSGSDMTPEAQALLERIRKHRANGGRVVCAFGKIVYDLAVPYAGGPAHSDMADFINHTVEAAAKAPNTLVLVKPHPHELRYEIARNPREYFTDLIKVPKPDNVVYLGHRWFNTRDMIKIIDLGLLWNGTTSLELGASGIPAVMCDDWGPRDYPVGHATPRDREHYEAMIRDPSIVTTGEDYRMRCIGLLKYLSTTDVMRPYRFAMRGLVNVDVGPPKWHFEEIERYLNEGDSFVSALADDFMF